MTSHTPDEEQLREQIQLLNGSGAHACYCPRSVDKGCECALSNEYVDELIQLISAHIKQKEREAELEHMAKQLYVTEAMQRALDTQTYGANSYAPKSLEDCRIELGLQPADTKVEDEA
jgi:hypothetical protein